MRLTADRAAALRDRGLSDNEVRVYLALLEHAALTGQVLTEVTGVPRNRLYEAIDALADRGLVEVDLEDATRRFRARPLAAVVDREIASLREEADRLAREREYYASTFVPPPPDANADVPWGALRLVTGRRATAREIERMLAGASRSLLVVASRGGGERALRHLSSLAEPPPEIAIQLPRSSLGAGGLERFLSERTLAAVTWLDEAPACFSVLRDGVELLQSTPVPDSADLRQGRDLTIVTENAGFIEDFLAARRAAPGRRA